MSIAPPARPLAPSVPFLPHDNDSLDPTASAVVDVLNDRLATVLRMVWAVQVEHVTVNNPPRVESTLQLLESTAPSSQWFSNINLRPPTAWGRATFGAMSRTTRACRKVSTHTCSSGGGAWAHGTTTTHKRAPRGHLYDDDVPDAYALVSKWCPPLLLHLLDGIN